MAEKPNERVQIKEKAEAATEWRVVIKESRESTEKTLDELSRDGWMILSIIPKPGANYSIAAYREKKRRPTQ
jgi:hypothetical protein